MPKLIIYRPKSVSGYISVRPGETKAGEKFRFITRLEELEESTAEFIFFGIPEDIGIRANYGKAGASGAWTACLRALLNVQHNSFFAPEKVLLLGEIDCSSEMEKASNFELSDPNYYIKLGELVEQIDVLVSTLVEKIISAGKKPIIIGGGHNNAFGNIKGAAEAFQKPLNVLNIDAHTDLRQQEHRHSGNGFTYALKEGFLRKFSVFGLHENYTPQYIFEEMNESENLEYTLLKDLADSDKTAIFKDRLAFVSSEKFALEVDCDSIAGFPSSATSPSGFTLDEVRSFIRIASIEINCSYLHLCEAVADGNYPTGKALSYMITDFIKAKVENGNY